MNLAKVWRHVMVLCYLPSLGAAAQSRVTLRVDRILLPTSQMDMGYIMPPILPYQQSGVVAADGMDMRLAVLPALGAIPKLIGRQGDGPGEFRNIPAVVIRGDSLVLTDPGLFRVTMVNGQTGMVMETWPVGIGAQWRNRTVKPIVAFARECWLGTVSQVIRRPIRIEDPVEIRTVFLLVHQRGAEIRYDSITTHDKIGTHIQPLGQMSANRVPSPVGSIPQLAVSPSGNGFAIIQAAPTPESAIVVHHAMFPCQNKVSITTIPVVPRNLTVMEVREEYRRRLSRGTSAAVSIDARIDDAMKQTVKVQGKFRAPPFTAALLDDRGVLWIEVEGVYGLKDFGRPRLWWQVDRSGRLMLELVVPSDIRLQSATSTRALGWRTSEHGGEVVVLGIPK